MKQNADVGTTEFKCPKSYSECFKVLREDQKSWTHRLKDYIYMGKLCVLALTPQSISHYQCEAN